MKAEYVEHYGTDLSVVNAARVSFANESQWELENDPRNPQGVLSASLYPLVKKLSNKDAKLVNYLAKHKHTSCFEHQGATLRIKVPIFIARHIQRHRTFSYNEVSRRYVDSAPEFFWPDKWRAKAENVKQGSSDEEVHIINVDGGNGTPQQFADAALRQAVFAYTSMLNAGVAPELARMILPQNMYTEFYMTGNLRNWMHFLSLRTGDGAQVEVQQLAEQVRNILEPLFPVSVKALIEHK